jgi:hypothetical protein
MPFAKKDLPLANQKFRPSIGMLHGEASIVIHDTPAFARKFSFGKARNFQKKARYAINGE